MALDLIRDADGDVVGVTALEMETGELHILEAKTTLLATGGAGRIFAASTNAFINTGDGLGMAARAGIPLRGHGVLAVPPDRRAQRRRAADRRLPRRRRDPAQRNGERFMERYAPTLKDLAPRDFVVALHGPGDQGRARLRSEQGLHQPRHDAPGRRDDHEAPAQRVRDRPQLRQRRHHQGADPRGADHPLPDGRHPDQHPRPGGGAEGRRPEQRRQRPVRGGRMLLRQRARRQPPGHQLAARPAGLRPRGRHATSSTGAARRKAHKPLPADAADALAGAPGAAGQQHRGRIRAGRGQRHPQHDAAARRRVPHPGQHGRGRGQDRRAGRARQGHRA